jgi:hypothetical protein
MEEGAIKKWISVKVLRTMAPAIGVVAVTIGGSLIYSMIPRQEPANITRNKSLHALSIATKQQVKRGSDPDGLDFGSGSKGKAALNKEFLRQIIKLIKIAIPGFKTKEAMLLALHTFFLILRTYLSVLGAEIDGNIVRYLVILQSLNDVDFR